MGRMPCAAVGWNHSQSWVEVGAQETWVAHHQVTVVDQAAMKIEFDQALLLLPNFPAGRKRLVLDDDSNQ
jgi:hypothetical protein